MTEKKIYNFKKFTKREKFSVALLLWVTAHVDGHLHPIEIFDIKVGLKKLFAISDDEVRMLIASVDQVRNEQEFVNKAIEDLSEYFDEEFKERLVNLACHIALSDRVVHPKESAFTEMVSDELKIN